MVSTVEEAQAVLYAEPVAEFVGRRNELVKEIRAGGDRALAAQVKDLRKPSVVAAEINRMARANGEAVEALLHAVNAVRSAQADVMAGGEVDMAGAQTAYRGALQALVRQAEAQADKVRAGLEAIALDPDSHEALRGGSLAVVPAVAIGFDVPTAGVASRPAKKRKAKAKKPTKPKRGDAAVDPTDAHRLEAERIERERAATTARLEAALDDATNVHKDALNAATAAERERDAAQNAVAATTAELTELEQHLSELRASHELATERAADAESTFALATDRLAEAAASVEAATAAASDHRQS